MLVLALSAVPALASAADLVVGVVHDTHGFPVAGATVTLHGAGGNPAGSGKTAADGTFAVDASMNAATVDIRCSYCVWMTVPHISGRPVVAVVRRFAALRDRGISATDARVLPYSSVGDLASLLPFAVVTPGAISDRGLAGARGSVIADGIALYRTTDGVDLGAAIPAFGTATITQTAPTGANVYDANSAGGLFSIDTLDQSAGLVRADASTAGDLVIRGGNALRGAFATSGGSNAASRAVLDGTVPAGGGTLNLRAVTASALNANASGFATTFTAPLRAASLTTSLSMSRSADANGPENDDVAALALQSGEVTYGVRAQRTSGYVIYGTGVQYDLRGYVQAVHDDGRTRIFASLAAAQNGETLRRRASSAGALLPILSVTTRIAPSFVLHADSVDALTAAPLYLLLALPDGTAVNRSHLTDAGLGFDDGNRIRIDAMVFRQTAAEPAFGTTGGSGISAVWQIAPSLAVRSWALISRAGGTDYYGGNIYNPAAATNLDRNVTWVTAGNVLRVDAIWRGNGVEGDVSFPAGSRGRFTAGTRRDGPNRVFTAGISWP